MLSRKESTRRASQEGIPHRKLVYKRNVRFTILLLGWAYVLSNTFATGALDVPDINPKFPPFYYSASQFISNSNSTKEGISVPQINCTDPTINDFPPDLFTQAQRRQGALVFHFFVSIYIFYAIALVCDDYFVPSIESICEQLHLPSDVAGATFMAIATSAPELFTNVIGTFVTQGDLGIGTIVGSAVFNILAVSACCGLAAKETLHLEWWSLTRDCFFYSISVIMLLVVLENGKVFWYEALVLIAFYGIYILVMYYNATCKEWAEGLVYGFGRKSGGKHARKCSKQERTFGNEGEGEQGPLIGGNTRKTSYNGQSPDDYKTLELSFEERDEILITKALYQTEVDAEEEKAEWGLFTLPFGEGWLKWIEWTVGWPARFVLVFTVPDCRNHRFRKWYPLTFLMCIFWIALLTYVMSWMMTVIGYTLAVPDSVMGLTFIAAGTSVPEAVSSIIVSRQGLGSMGISNSIGSNTFDILICLGVPWLIRGSLIATSSPNYIEIISGGLEYSTILLISSVIILYLLLACNRFVLDIRIGLISLSMYATFLIISSLFELNVFFPVNLPTCLIET